MFWTVPQPQTMRLSWPTETMPLPTVWLVPLPSSARSTWIVTPVAVMVTALALMGAVVAAIKV